MKRSQERTSKLSSSTPKNIRVKYTTWHAILIQLMLGRAFLTSSWWKSPHNTHLTHKDTRVTLNTHEQCYAQSQEGHSPDLHTVLTSTVAALHVSLKFLSLCPTNTDPNAVLLSFISLEEWSVWRDAPVTISQLLVQSMKQGESVTRTEDQGRVSKSGAGSH